ncbi:hypothetical protein GPICK_13245 [Geobacter pickeringii]|uniref:Uncharacterized protein n=1 Tax=Geobacter pickeringii TaxID=345632 RepID=A0A0B5BI57_9BACT|nr:hypothetical protein GPICK_13245 [Geobacter pickeringii]
MPRRIDVNPESTKQLELKRIGTWIGNYQHSSRAKFPRQSLQNLPRIRQMFDNVPQSYYIIRLNLE